MRQGRESLPFELQGNASPKQLSEQKQVIVQASQRYISSVCKTGPISNSYLSMNDVGCLIIYVILLVASVILFCINFFSGKMIQDPPITQLGLFSLLAYALAQSLPETMISCSLILAFGFVIMGVVVLLPFLAGYFIILCCLGLLCFVLYSLVNEGYIQVFDQITLKQQAQSITSVQLFAFRISLIIVVCIGILLICYLILKRIKKLKYLGSLMQVTKIVLISNFPLLSCFILFVMSGISAGIWCCFTKAIWNCGKMMMTDNMTIPPTIVLVMVLILWIWTHGFIMSISDYICESWILHWYFNANIDSRRQHSSEQMEGQVHWKYEIFTKLFRYHIGTCIYGSIVSAYISQNLIKMIRKISNRNTLIGHLSRYCYIETVMEGFNYCNSNKETFYLRQRIKSKTPWIYMLGHFMEDILKVSLVISGGYFWVMLSDSFKGFLAENISDLSLVGLVVLCLVVGLGVLLQISNNISHIIGIISDTAVIAYNIDCQVQRVHYHNNQCYSCPSNLKQAIRKLQIDVRVQSDRKYDNNENKVGNINNIRSNENNQKYPNLHSYYEMDKNNISPYYLGGTNEI